MRPGGLNACSGMLPPPAPPIPLRETFSKVWYVLKTNDDPDVRMEEIEATVPQQFHFLVEGDVVIIDAQFQRHPVAKLVVKPDSPFRIEPCIAFPRKIKSRSGTDEGIKFP
jgi:hypothetical protein